MKDQLLDKKEKLRLKWRRRLINNKDKINLQRRERYAKNKIEITERRRKNYAENKEKITLLRKTKWKKPDSKKAVARVTAWRLKNPEKLRIQRLKYKKPNNEETRAKDRIRARLWRERNKEKVRLHKREYEKQNRHLKTKDDKKYRDKRKKIDHVFKLKILMRTRLYQFFKARGKRKLTNTIILLGANYETVAKHIEERFTDGMCWQNYGLWHVDHKTPLASAISEDDVRALCHYKNLQPLWAKDNIQKNDKIIP